MHSVIGLALHGYEINPWDTSYCSVDIRIRLERQKEVGSQLKKFLVLAIFLFAGSGVSQTSTCSNLSLGFNGALNGFVPSPNDAWHRDISAVPIDPNSALIITTNGDLGGAFLRPDFSSIANGNFGIPYTVVDSATTPGVPVPITLFPSDSDITLNPISANLAVEGSPAQCPTDGNARHAIIVDRNGCVVYELFQAAQCNAGWTASSSAIWDLTTTEQRPYGLMSADAAGLSVFSGLVRYDEIVAGAINHAIRFTAQNTKNNANNGFFTAPATHAAGNSPSTDNIMGMRIRLQANFDISDFSPTNQIILKAMKQFGMILADNGSDMSFQGTPDARWDDSDLSALTAVPSSAFDVVQMDAIYDSSTAPTGPPPTIVSFTASASTVTAGTSVTLTSTVTNGSYEYIDQVGFVRGPVTVTPAATTTYLLTSRNAFGTTTASTTVTVSGSMGAPTLQFAAIPTQTFGATPFAVSATSNSSGAIAYTVASGLATLSGSTVALTGTGNVVLNASQSAAGNYTAGSAQTSFAVNAGSPSLAFVSIPDQVSGAAPFSVTTTTNSTGSIAYAVASGPAAVSGNQVTVTGVGTVALQANQAASGNYAAAVAATSFNVAGSGALTFASIPDPVFGATPFTVSASSASPGAIAYFVTFGPGSISGSTFTVTHAGAITLLAKQAASGGFPAATTTATFNVTPATPTLAFATVPAQTVGVPFNVIASSQSVAAVAYSVLSGPATISGRSVTLTGTGTVTLQASQAALGDYAATTATTSLTAAGTMATLTFAGIPSKTFGTSPPFTVSATSASPGAVTYSATIGPATVSGSTVTLTGAGTVTLSANQAASGSFPAASASTGFNVAGITPTLTFAGIPSQTFGTSPPFTVSATSASPGAVTYAVASGPAIIVGNIVTLTGAGSVTLNANQAAAGNFGAGAASTSFNVAGQGSTLAFVTIPSQIVGAAPFAVIATSSSPGAIAYSVVSGPARLSGTTVTVTAVGQVVLQASQAAVGSFPAATGTTAFSVVAAPSWVQLTSLPSAIQANGTPAKSFVGTDGYFYVAALPTGSSPRLVNKVYRTPVATPGIFTDITGTGLPGNETSYLMGMMPNGTLLITMRAGSTQDIYYWNGSTSAPAWKKVTGWTGVSASNIYTFPSDSSGYTYFSPAWSGDIWRNDAPGSTNFTRQIINLYGITGGGTGTGGGSGGLFGLRIWDLGDGKGNMYWACGEGELDNIALNGDPATNTSYLTAASGFTHNCLALDKSPAKIMAVRSFGGSSVNIIDIATRAVTVVPSPTPVPAYLSSQRVNVLQWMSGKNWLLNNTDGHTTYLLLSKDDGLTWINIASGLGSNCTGGNLSVGATASAHYVFAKCSNGRAQWVYGPVN
ncbi:MAG: hypothetical protein M3R43_02395 [Acidobacteriota bacterium]|nr:hypothetical protein [Acidobacteriota bacterium]